MLDAVSERERSGRITGAVSLVANLAVLVSLVLVVMELRQNRQSLDATAQIAIATALQEVGSRQTENADLAEIITRWFLGAPDPTSLFGIEGVSVADGTRFMSWMSEWTTVLFTTWELKNAGVVDCRRVGRSLIYRADFGAMNALLGFLTENCCEGAGCPPSRDGARR